MELFNYRLLQRSVIYFVRINEKDPVERNFINDPFPDMFYYWNFGVVNNFS